MPSRLVIRPVSYVIAETQERKDIYTDRFHDAMFIRDLDGTIKEWNEGAIQLYGWDPSETVGKTSHRLLETVFPCSLASIDDELRRNGVWEGTLVHKRRDGSHVVVHSRWQLQRVKGNQNPIVVEVNSQEAVEG